MLHCSNELSRWTVRIALLACLSTLVVRCPQLPELQWKGEYVALGAEEPERVCAGTAEYMDRNAGELFDKLGTDPIQVEYYLLNDVDDFCPFDNLAVGCASDGLVYSEWVPLMHEVVHARVSDGMPRVLEEGLATYLGDPFPIVGMASRERMAELLTQDVEWLTSITDYGRAAHFMAFLDEQFGWDSILMLDAMLSLESTVADTDAAFLAVFDLDIQAVLELYDGFPECAGTVDTSLACAGSATRAGFPSAVWQHRVDCASTDAIGPDNDMVFVEQLIELGPAIGKKRMIGVTGDGALQGGFVLLRRCGACSENGVGIIHGPGPYFIRGTELPAGRYVARFYRPLASAPATVGLRVDG
jgi:hypothetical protein